MPYTDQRNLLAGGLAGLNCVGFDIESASAKETFLGRFTGPFVRLCGWTDRHGVQHLTEDPAELIAALDAADVIYGHNILGFDLLALAEHCGADFGALSLKAVDTMTLARLADPPLSKGMPNGYYGLDAVAHRSGHVGKTDDLKGLAARCGGFDRIPRNAAEHFARVRSLGGQAPRGDHYFERPDRAYRDYLRGDLAATDHVFTALSEVLETEYGRRELFVVALQNYPVLTGWAVDAPLLAERVKIEADKQADAIVTLNRDHGVPTHYPDTFRVLPLKEWMEPRLKGQTRTSWRWGYVCDSGHEPGEDEELCNEETCFRRRVVLKKTQAAFPTVAAVRRYTALYPLAAVARGYASRRPGEAMIKPWTTTQGKEAIIRAFGEAGCVTATGKPAYPTTPTGEIKLGKDALGREPWYCNERRRNFPGVLQVFGDKPAVASLVETLLLASGARAKYAEIANNLTPAGDRVHPWVGAAQGSGRWALTSPGISTMGARGAAAAERDVMIADGAWEREFWGEECVHVTCDLSAVDVRAVAIASQDPALIQFLQPGEDYHMEMAYIFFGERTKENRGKGKPISHGSNYGQGAKSVADRNGLPLIPVKIAMRRRAEAMPYVEDWKADVRSTGETTGILDNHFGRKMRVDPQRAYTQAPALVGQGMARDIMCESMIRFVDFARERHGWDVRPMIRGVIHDELVLSVPRSRVPEVQALLTDAMTWEKDGVPILCELGKTGLRWSEAK